MKTAQIGIQLRKARRAAGLTQAELARRMGTTQSAVARAESGLVMPSLDFVERFIQGTGQPLQLGSLHLWSAEVETPRDEQVRRVRRAVGDYEFNPWLRSPSPSEQKSLEADGLTRERFERTNTPPARGR